MSHARRTAISRHAPLLVTSRLCSGLPSLRSPEALAVLQRAFGAGAERFGFRLVHFSLESNHLHLIVEAQDAVALSRGTKGLLVRAARALNRLWGRQGPVVADRYHARVLGSPREVRSALVYVLQNARKHGCSRSAVDPFSSAPWFDAWEHPPGRDSATTGGQGPPVVAARSWLLRVGWKRHGLIDLAEAPSTARRAG